MSQEQNPKIKDTVEMLRRMLHAGSEPAKEDTKPKGPEGLPSTTPNQNSTVDHHYDGENLTDPGVINGVTATGGGAIIT